MEANYSIRAARQFDLPLLSAIERSAGQVFRKVGLDSVADDEPIPIEVLGSYLEAGNLWVAEAVGARTADPSCLAQHQTRSQTSLSLADVVAFLAAFPLHQAQSPNLQKRAADQSFFLHIAELSVHAEHQRKGLATRLVEELVRYAEHLGEQEKLAQDQGRTGVREAAGAAHSHSHAIALSLTTYKDVPFNAPFYAKLGFETISSDQIGYVVGKRGRELWDEEQERVAWKEGRVWMVRWLT